MYKKVMNRKVKSLIVWMLVAVMQLTNLIPAATVFADESNNVASESTEAPGGTSGPAIDADLEEDIDDEADREEEPVMMLGAGPKDLGNIFTEVRVILNDEELQENSMIEITDGMDLRMEFDWVLTDEVDLASGDFATINLPHQFKIPGSEEGDLKNGDEVVGNYSIQKNGEVNVLKVVFNDKLKGKKQRAGDVWVNFQFHLEEFNKDAIQKIQFETKEEKNFTIKAKQEKGNLIYKIGEANAKVNADKITWTIDVNTSLRDITNAVISDKIPVGLKLEGDIDIYKLKVGREGIIGIDEDSLVGKGYFPIELGNINSAYRILYKTTVDNRDKSPFINKASVKGDNDIYKEDDDQVSTPAGSLIEKSDGVADNSNNAKEITWTIKVNEAGSLIKGAKVKDSIETPLKYKEGSLEVYEITIGSEGEVIRGDKKELTPTFNQSEMEINLGDIDSAYEIKYITDIEYGYEPEDYGKKYTFNNTARLIGKVGGEDKKLGEDTGKVNVKRANMLTKTGIKIITPSSKKINWTIKVNEAGDKLGDVWVEDTSGEGISYVEGSMKVIRDSDDQKITLTGDNLKVPGDDGKDFKLILGDIDSSYTVTYSTQITDFNRDNFTNEAQISWIKRGVGPGPGYEDRTYIDIDLVEVSAKIENNLVKHARGINYKEKTMDWEIEIAAYKGVLSNIVIEDTFTNNGLFFLDDKITIKHRKANADVIDVDGYVVEPQEGGYGKGFIIRFPADFKFEDSVVKINYSTSFDSDKYGLTDGFIENEKRKYINKAEIIADATYKEKTVPFKDNHSADQSISDIAFDNGKKKGNLNKEERTISWDIYVNHMSKDFSAEDFVVTDTFSEGQTLDLASFNIRPYTINKKGAITIEDAPIEQTDYTVVESDNELGFTLNFIGGIKTPFKIEYTTQVKGISKEKYTNKAEVTGGDKYTDSVDYPDYDSFISKEATNTSGSVWIDDKIEWEIRINDNLSDIEEGAIIEDTIGSGLVYLDGSLEVIKQDGLTRLDNNKYDVDVETTQLPGTDEKVTKLTVTFREGINEIYTVKYSTIVVTKKGTVSNMAIFNGEKVVGEHESGQNFTVKRSSGGTGSGIDGDSDLGKIIINKVDIKGVSITAEAEFKIYYKIGDQQILVEGKKHKTEDGKIELTDLGLDRIYYIKEVTAPNGFEFDSENPLVEILVEKPAGTDNEGAYIESIQNENIKMEVIGTKVWEGGPKPDIQLQLYRNSVALVGKVGTLKSEDKASHEWKYTWTDLDKTDNTGEDYVYTVKEVVVPDNYTKSENALTVTNTYVIPTTQVTVTKVWVDGPEVKPDIELQLYKDGEPHLEPVKLEYGELTHTWNNLDKTDIDGKEHVYTVDEVKEPEHYGKSLSEDGFKITNTYKSPVTDIVGRKVWVDGPSEKADIELQLYRKVNGGQEVKVEDAVVLQGGTTSYNWKNQDITDKDGNKYEYTVKEVGVPDNYRKSEDGLTVTNTYIIPKTQVTGTKVWDGGPSVKPDIELQLYKNGKAEGEPVTLEGGTTKHTWKDIDKTDIKGKEHVYTVDEVKVPSGYRKLTTGESLEVVNRRIPDDPAPELPKGKLSLGKKVSGDKADKDKKFKFTIDFDSGDQYYFYDGNGVKNGVIFQGETVELAHGESILIRGIPKGTKYIVTESDYSEEGYVTQESGSTGIIEEGKTSVAEFINKKGLEDPDPEEPVDPEEPDAEEPVDLEEPEPIEPTEPTEPEEQPRYTKLPDPNDPDSPDELILIDEDGIPIGKYIKKEKPDGSFEYIELEDEDIPLGELGEKPGESSVDKPVSEPGEELAKDLHAPQTGDNTPVIPLLIVFIISLLSTVTLIIFRKKKCS